MQDFTDFWLRLDNAAKIYPAVKSTELTAVFRISVDLMERVKAKQFIEAIQSLENRFPYYKVTLKAGFFWYYLEPADLPFTVIPDSDTPCRAFEKQELLFRILVKANRISVEFSHILTDGTGALEFLKTLLFLYLEKTGVQLPQELHFHQPKDVPIEEEYEDAYNRYFKKIDSVNQRQPNAFHVPFRLNDRPRLKILTAELPVKSIAAKAKEYEVSITDYLVAVYLHSLQELYEEQSSLKKHRSNKIIRIEVPVNLRRIFPSRTMRNFSLYVMPGIDLHLGHYSFEEIVKIVFHQIRLETDRKLISKMISRNVSGEKNLLVRTLPLFIKSLFLSILYSRGTKQYSGVVTNMGNIDLGTEINSLIKQFIFIPPPPNDILKVNCAAAGFNGKLNLTFCNITVSKELERRFLSFLTNQGIAVKLTWYN